MCSNLSQSSPDADLRERRLKKERDSRKDVVHPEFKLTILKKVEKLRWECVYITQLAVISLFAENSETDALPNRCNNASDASFTFSSSADQHSYTV